MPPSPDDKVREETAEGGGQEEGEGAAVSGGGGDGGGEDGVGGGAGAGEDVTVSTECLESEVDVLGVRPSAVSQNGFSEAGCAFGVSGGIRLLVAGSVCAWWHVCVRSPSRLAVKVFRSGLVLVLLVVCVAT